MKGAEKQRSIKLTKKELNKILEDHKKYLNDLNTGEKADLSHADLSHADLSYADLSHADLSHADLRSANLSHADLRSADLSSADLSSANLSSANLSHADLRSANLSHADLRPADLSSADLSSANLRYADLSHADLSYADLSHADLSSANLSSANLSYAENLQFCLYNENTVFFALQCPEEGEFIGWKKCQGNVIVKLLILADSFRSSATTRKCRASKVKVLKVFGAKEGISNYISSFIYKTGKTIKSDSWDTNRWNECSHGIHFFITRKEAENYD